MTNDDLQCHVDECEWTGDSLAALRSHVSGSKDPDHQQARTNRAWEGWYPEKAGVVDPSEEGDEPPSTEGSNDDPEPTPDPNPSESTDDGGDDEGGSDPAEGGPDPTDEYAEQWGSDDPGDSDPDKEGSDGGSDPGDGGGSGGSTPSGDGGSGVGAGAALAAGSLLVGLLAVLIQGEDGDEPVEVESTAETVDPDDEGADEGVDISGWEGSFE